MKTHFEKLFKNNENDNNNEEDKRKRRIILYIIIIIILLLLITSCSCTSKFFGKIGSMFQNGGDYTVDPDTNDQEIIRNRDLQFDVEQTEMSLSDGKTKVSFSYKNINPNGFTCSTSDAEIATCYVSSNYVVVIPKKSGEVMVTLQTKTNGKVYEATTKVIINDINRSIELSSTNGTLNLANTKKMLVSYSLIGLVGDLTVTSSDERIATAVIKDGILEITGLKPGNVTFTLSLTYNGISYSAEYTLEVVNNSKTNNSSSTSRPGSGNSSNPGGNNPGNPVDPSVPSNPSEEDKLSSDSTLKRLESNKGILEFDPNKLSYQLGVGFWNFSATFTAVPTNPKASVTYIYNGEVVKSLNKLKLQTGDNTLKIVVTSEDKSSTTTYEVHINRAKSSNNYLKELTPSVGVLSPKFDKNTLSYGVDVDYKTDYMDLKAVLKRPKRATMTYTFNGKSVSSLNHLKLQTGANVVVITITAQNGVTRNYTVVINKESIPGVKDSNSLLSSLTIDKGTLNFNPMVTDYFVGVPNDVSMVTLNAIASSNKANLTYIYGGRVVDDLNELVLEEGDNPVKVIVTAEDGSKTEYTVVINRGVANHSTSLTNLTTSIGVLSPVFNEDVLEYSVVVPYTTERISLYPEAPSSSTMTYTYNGVTYDNLDDLPLGVGSNVVTITVSNGTSSRTYQVVITREADPTKSDVNTLESLSVKDNVGVLSPTFVPEHGEYTIEVAETVDKISFEAKPSDNAKIISVTYNGGETSLDDIPLEPGKNNHVVITVEAENGATRQYTIDINRLTSGTPSDSTELDSLTVLGNAGELVLDPKGDYYLAVSGKLNEVSLEAKSKGTLSYQYKPANASEFTSVDTLNNLPLVPGVNDVVIRVTAQDGVTYKDYYVHIYKPVYTIDIEKSDYTFYLEDTAPYTMIYRVLDEKDEVTDDYNVSDVHISGLENFKGQVLVEEGYIKLIPDGTSISELLKESYKVTASYFDKTDKANITFATHMEYYIKTSKDTYKIDKDKPFDIVFNNNLLLGDVKAEAINNFGVNGVHLTSSGNSSYIDITTDSTLVKILTNEDGLDNPSSVAIQAKGTSVGEATLHVLGSINGYTIEFDIKVIIADYYDVVIDAVDGFFDAFTVKHVLRLEHGSVVDLSEYVAYKEADTGNCMYYELLQYTANGNIYNLTDKVEITDDITFTAVYEGTSKYIELKDEGHMYLTDVDLFHNEEYYRQYGEDKVIYPGAHGSYVMTIENNKADTLTLTGINLTEDTICVDGNKCLNMGYIIKYSKSNDTNYKFYYGAENRFAILNQDATKSILGNRATNTYDIPFSPTIEIPKGEKVEISLIWEWVDQDDVSDTAVGDYAAKKRTDASINDLYELTVRIDFETQNKHCTLTDTN